VIIDFFYHFEFPVLHAETSLFIDEMVYFISNSIELINYE
jgi:hypothetical protein